MKFLRFFLSVILLALVGCAAPKQVRDPQMKAGVAEIEITPPVGFRMAGYYDERFSTGIHDPLKAKAMVLQQGNEKVALVFCDLVGMSLQVTTNARARISQLYGIKFSNVSIFATHSHTGPLFDDVRSTFFHEDSMARLGKDEHQPIDYPAFLAGKIVQVVGEANGKLQASDLLVGIAEQEGLPFNRRFHMKNGRTAFNPGQLNPNIVEPAGPVDHDVSMVLVRPEGKEPVGGLTVFAMHADTTGGTDFSADYPFYLQQVLRGKFGGDYISLFGAGTCGDLSHIDVTKKTEVKGPVVAEGLGRSIGKTVLANVPELNAIRRPRLAAVSEVAMLPLQKTTPEKLKAAKANMHLLPTDKMNFYDKVEMVKAVDLDARGAEWRMEVQAYRLDDETAIVALPAEIFVELGLAIKKNSPFKKTIVIALNNDRPSYIPTLRAFKEGGYETVNSRLAPGTGEKLVQMALGLLNKLYMPESPDRVRVY